MEVIRRILSYSVLLLLSYAPVRSQSDAPFVVGLLGERSFGLVDGTASIYAGSPGCGLFTSGSISSVGFGGMFSMPTLFSSRLGLTLRSGWRSSVVEFATRGDTAWFDNDTNDALPVDHEYRLQVSSGSLNVALLGTYRIGSRVALGFGPEMGYRFDQDVVQTDRLLGPGDRAFEGGQTTRVMTEGPTYTAVPLSFSLLASGSVTVPIGSHLSFLFEATATAELISPVREAEWKGLAFGGSAGLVFDLGKEVVPPPLPEITEPSAPPAPLLNLTASVDIYGLEGEKRTNTITSRFREVEYCRSVMIAPEVLFENGSIDLPQIYRGFDPTASSLPTIDSLASLDPFALQERVLDVIGLRLRDNSEDTIVLRASDAADERAERQLERVREYLGRVWSVEMEQVVTERNRTGNPNADVENERRGDRVVIVASTGGILDPVVSRRLDRDFEAPLVKVTTSHQADAGLRAWEVVLASRDKMITRYSSSGPRDEGTGSMNWNALADDGVDSSTITAQFRIEDSTGARKTVRGEAPLRMLRSRIGVAHAFDMKEMSESILLWLPASAEGWNDSLGYDDLRREADRRLRQGASVWITVNKHISKAQRDSMSAILQQRGDVELHEIAPEELLENVVEAGGCADSQDISASPILLLIRQRLEE